MICGGSAAANFLLLHQHSSALCERTNTERQLHSSTKSSPILAIDPSQATQRRTQSPQPRHRHRIHHRTSHKTYTTPTTNLPFLIQHPSSPRCYLSHSSPPKTYVSEDQVPPQHPNASNTNTTTSLTSSGSAPPNPIAPNPLCNNQAWIQPLNPAATMPPPIPPASAHSCPHAHRQTPSPPC